MSLPICLAAKILGINIFLIEPNMVLGRANKFFLNFSKKLICYSKNLINLPSGINHKLTTIKPLIRKEYYETSTYQKPDNLFTIIIIGGSQGAKIFDELLNKFLINNFVICFLLKFLAINLLDLKFNLSKLITFDQGNFSPGSIFLNGAISE